MAEYTPELNLFKPGTDDNMGIESTLSDNFMAIDTKLGGALTDIAGTKWTTLKERLNDEQSKFNVVQSDVTNLKARSVNVILNQHLFRVISNRGASGFPENSYPAYYSCIDWGQFGIFADVQLSSDNYWMCYRHADLSTQTNGTGTVASQTKAQLKTLDIGSKYHGVYAGQQMPDLDDLLLLLRSTQSVPFLNVVGTYTDLQMKSLVDKLKAYDLYNDAVITSALYTNLTRVRLYSKEIALGLYVNSYTTQLTTDVKSLGNGFMFLDYSQVNDTNINEIHNNNVPIIAYLDGSNDIADNLRPLIAKGIRGVVSKKPNIRGV